MICEISKFNIGDAAGGRHLAKSPDVSDPVAAPDANQDPARLGSAGNAITHWLTTRKILPDSLRLRTVHFAAEFRRELRPAGILENVLVSEIARHAAGMELAGHAEGSILRFCGQHRSDLGLHLDPDGQASADAAVTAAIANPAIERLGRYRGLHEGAFYRALSRLRDLQVTRQATAVHDQFAKFRSEVACADYLFECARRRAEACPRCGRRNGHWLARRRWECSFCGLQVGQRSGTVMASSRLPLRAWFIAIGEILADPQIGVERLQEKIGLPRLGTVRKLQRKILAAIESPDVDRLLAGLQRLAPGAGPPEFSDLPEHILAKRP